MLDQIEFVIGRFQWQGVAKDVMICSETCELCLCVSVVYILHAHVNFLIYMTDLYLNVVVQEMCLYTRLLATANTPFADFLDEAIEPPVVEALSNALQLLKVSL
jgi:hypothetical protein